MFRWVTRLAVVVRSLVTRRRADLELDEELTYHLDREVHERVRAGLSPKEARYAALRAMGAIEKNKEECRDLRSGETLASVLRGVPGDAKFALRLFRKHPGPVGIAVGGLAVAIGVVCAAFSIVNATMLRPYGMDDPPSVVSLMTMDHSRPWPYRSYASFLRLREGATLARLEAYVPGRARIDAVPSTDSLAERWMQFVSGGYLDLLGGRPALGRTLAAADDAPGAPPVVVLSHYFWRTEYRGDPSVIGTTIWINGAPAAIAGVLRPDFTGPVDFDLRPAVWAPLAARDELRAGPAMTPASNALVQVVGRLPSGVSTRVAEAELTAIVARSRPASANASQPPPDVRLFRAASPIDGPGEADVYMVLASITGLVGLVLAIACANTANLLLAAAVTRVREVGVRLALGASRRRIVRQLVTESLVLGLVAGTCGFILAIWFVPVFGAITTMPPDVDLAPDGRALLFTAIVAIVCGLGAGLSPARFGARGNVLVALQAQSGTAHPAAARSRLRSTFVGFQAAVSMLLLVAAALFVRSAVAMTRVDAGFDANRLLAVSAYPQQKGVDQVAYLAAAFAALRDVPAVERVTIALTTPFGSSSRSQRVKRGDAWFTFDVIQAGAAYPDTVGVRVLRGRAFTDDEAASEAPVALVSERAARLMFGDADPIGQRLSTEVRGEDRQVSTIVMTVVGVVSEAMLTRPDDTRPGLLYRPLSERTFTNSYTDEGFRVLPSLLVRTATPGRTTRAVEDALRRVDPTVRPSTSLVGDRVEAYLSVTRTAAWIFGPPAVVALLLAALGVYGVTAFVVNQRRAEVSVRLALGASARDVLRLLVIDSLRPVGIGLFVGLAGALAFAQVAASEFRNMSPYDPVAIGTALAVLLAAALIAVVVPARRAARVDPAGLLRQA